MHVVAGSQSESYDTQPHFVPLIGKWPNLTVLCQEH
uniref:Uncharacterized protein n=1 Tax=Anguilla anguilla TaxID=7936 RepID=A0A0E9T2T5_ANGAN